MIRRRLKDSVSRGIAKRAEEKIAINDGDISSLMSSISSLQQQIIDLSAALESANAQISDLTTALTITNTNVSNLTTALATTDTNVSNLTTTFTGHTHGYTDVDQTGTTVSKTTSSPQ